MPVVCSQASPPAWDMREGPAGGVSSQAITAALMPGDADAGAGVRLAVGGGAVQYFSRAGACRPRASRRLEDVLGAHAEGGTVTVHAYPVGRGRRRRYRPLRARLATAEGAARAAAAVRAALPAELGRARTALVLVNPASGKGQAERVYRRSVADTLLRAGVDATVVFTERQGHATDVARGLGSASRGAAHDMVVVVGGDGILHEVLNGLPEGSGVPVAVIPGGSGNAVAMSLLDGAGLACTPENAAFAAARGATVAADLLALRQRGQNGGLPIRAVLSSTWGLISDVDIESEVLRWMGGARLTVYGLWRILRLRTYEGRVCFLPAAGEEAGEAQGARACGRPRGAADEGAELAAIEAGEGDSAWRVVEGPLLFVWLKNTKWDAEDLKPAPQARLADGCVDLIYMRAPVSRWRLLLLFLQLETGAHVGAKGVHYVKCRRVVLEPGASSTGKGGHVNVDGELLCAADARTAASQGYSWAYGEGSPVDVSVLPGASTLVAPEGFAEDDD